MLNLSTALFWFHGQMCFGVDWFIQISFSSVRRCLDLVFVWSVNRSLTDWLTDWPWLRWASGGNDCEVHAMFQTHSVMLAWGALRSWDVDSCTWGWDRSFVHNSSSCNHCHCIDHWLNWWGHGPLMRAYAFFLCASLNQGPTIIYEMIQSASLKPPFAFSRSVFIHSFLIDWFILTY